MIHRPYPKTKLRRTTSRLRRWPMSPVSKQLASRYLDSLPLPCTLERTMDEVISTGRHEHESRIIFLTSIGHTLCHIGELAYFGLIPAIVTEHR